MLEVLSLLDPIDSIDSIYSALDSMPKERLQKISYIASGFGFIVAAAALLVSALANNANRRVRRATFWLDIRKMFSEHNDVYKDLQKGGSWYRSDTQPADPQDRAKVVAYLSLLEQVKQMLDKRLIDKRTIDATQVPFRVRLILQNGPIKRLIHGKHEGEKSDWPLFKKLVKDFDKRYGKKDNFNYLGMLENRQGGGPEIAPRDSGKREKRTIT